MEHNDALVCRTYAFYFEWNNLFHKNSSFVWKKVIAKLRRYDIF